MSLRLRLRLRALRSLITREFPRTRSKAETESSRATVSRAAAAGAGATAAFSGFLYFKKGTTTSSDQSAGCEVTTTTNATETRKEEAPVTPVVVSQATKDDGGMDDAAVRAMFMGKDGKMRWLDYVDYLTFGKTFDKEVRPEDHDDEEAKERRRTALRDKRFKRSARKVDTYHALSEGVYLGLSDREDIISDEEWELMTPDPLTDQDWEEYVKYVETLKAIDPSSLGRIAAILRRPKAALKKPWPRGKLGLRRLEGVIMKKKLGRILGNELRW
ncbi:hypothetical protein EJB05_33531, partial [Eragrostis curvula]